MAEVSTLSCEINLEALSGMGIPLNKLVRLTHSLDQFYELIYELHNDITPEDYRIIEPQMLLLLNTLKELHNTNKRIRTTGKLSEEVEALRRNYSAFYELNSDFKNFSAKQISSELSEALKKASAAMKRI